MNKINKNKNYDKNSKSPKIKKGKMNSSQSNRNSHESIKSKSGSLEFNFLDKKSGSRSNPSEKEKLLSNKTKRDSTSKSPKSARKISNNQQDSEDFIKSESGSLVFNFLEIKYRLRSNLSENGKRPLSNKTNRGSTTPKNKKSPQKIPNNQQDSKDKYIIIKQIVKEVKEVSNFDASVENLKEDDEISKFSDKEQISNIDDSEKQKKTITIDNFDQCMPDTLEMFLNSLSKCFEINDECASSCWIDQTILLTFNSITIDSHKENKTINLIKQMYEFIVSHNKDEIDTPEENLSKQANLFKEMVDFHYNAKNKHQIIWTNLKPENLPDYLPEYLNNYIRNLKIPQELAFTDLYSLCNEVFRNFAVCFRRIISSQYFEKFKNTNIQIVCAGSIGEHAEIKMARNLVKYHLKIGKEFYIATSKRPCGLCFEIINKIFHEQFNIKIKTRTTSNLFFKHYVTPTFIERNTQLNKIYEDLKLELKNAVSSKTLNIKFEPMNKSTEFEFKFDASQLEQRISNLEKSVKEIKSTMSLMRDDIKKILKK